MLLLELLLMALALVAGRFALAQTPGESEVEVQLKQGLIKGMKEDSGEGHSIYSFKNIPFAEPPVGDLRLRDPLPAGAWSGVRDGTIDPSPCMGFDLFGLRASKIKVVGQEDCLYLNVFTPEVNRSDLPVMVWIHGGGFISGSAERPVLDLLRNVVFVSIQYRLVTLGFLSTEDSVLPGNLGLKDQTLALRWVHDNIRDLGGDPQKVTVFGVSAGAVSTHLQVLSPHATGLFQRAILQSGTALAPWAIGDKHAETAKDIGEIFECQAQDSTALLNCLQTVSAEELTKAASSQHVFGLLPNTMTPRVDGDFVPNYPATLLRNGVYNKVDLISGITRNEGAMYLEFLVIKDPSMREALVQNFSTVGPIVMSVNDLDYNPIYLSRKMYTEYVGGINADEDSFPKIEKLFTDRMFSVPQDETVMLHSRDTVLGKKVFAYELKHKSNPFIPGFSEANATTNDYVSHGEDMLYFFSSFAVLNDTSDLKVRDVFIKTWTNFAATGHPTPDYSLGYQWLPVTSPSSCLQHLDIVPTPFMHDDTRFKIRTFWKHLATHQNTILYPEIFYRDSLFVAPDMPNPCTLRGRSPFSQWFFVAF